MPKTPHEVLDDITRDLAVIWGEMAVFLIKKRVDDLAIDLDNINAHQVESIIRLLEEKTLPLTMGVEKAKDHASLYRKWLYGDTVSAN